MITPKEFPYLTSIYVNDCYAYQNFNIALEKHQPFSHLILTGKNGSGKSTILKALDSYFFLNLSGITRKNWNTEESERRIKENNFISPRHSKISLRGYEKEKSVIYSYLLPYRNSKVNEVVTPTKQDDFEKQLEQNVTSSDFFIKNFKQFLVNKKVNQAFAQLRNNKEEIEKTNTFFQEIEAVFGEIFEDKALKLVFIEESYEFLIKLTDGRKLTFDILPDGFSAFLSILMDLFVRLDLIRKIVNNHNYDPCGIVLIDEPETHLHLSLQYQVLPILTKLFPNVQFVVATHSPAVISSIKNVSVFDLTSKEMLSDEAISKSFSELMVSHFGLDNEFSSFTDVLFDEFNQILRENRGNIPQRNEKLKQLLAKNERYISPTMRFELEAKLLESL
jgi:predicted ATP-binding protein involved in virulence